MRPLFVLFFYMPRPHFSKGGLFFCALFLPSFVFLALFSVELSAPFFLGLFFISPQRFLLSYTGINFQEKFIVNGIFCTGPLYDLVSCGIYFLRAFFFLALIFLYNQATFF